MSTRNPLIQTSRETAKVLLAVALVKESRLTHFGIDINEELSRRMRAHRQPEKLKELEQEFIKERALLHEKLDAIAASADWIGRRPLQKTFNKRHTSYGYKHYVEDWFYRRGHGLYVSNGSFIAAAVGMELDYKRDDYGSPNLLFKFLERGLTERPGEAKS